MTFEKNKFVTVCFSDALEQEHRLNAVKDMITLDKSGFAW
jgi:hypothetical protein